MDEKTEELRDIFMDVAEDGTVTESQEESPGSITTDEEGVDERIAAVIDRMRERFDFGTDLDDADLVTVVRSFYDGDGDDDIADGLDVSTPAVSRARMDLHLFRDADTDAPSDLHAVRDLPDDAVERVAADVGVDADDIRRYRRIVEARAEARQVSQRFQSEFEEALVDAGLSTMTDAMPENGRTDATEDIDSLEEDADVGF